MIDPTELRTREHLTEREVERLIDAAKGIANGCSLSEANRTTSARREFFRTDINQKPSGLPLHRQKWHGSLCHRWTIRCNITTSSDAGRF